MEILYNISKYEQELKVIMKLKIQRVCVHARVRIVEPLLFNTSKTGPWL